jgi:hypothetical protein
LHINMLRQGEGFYPELLGVCPRNNPFGLSNV